VERIRVLASEKFYDKMVFSFVEISNDNDEEWIAKVLVYSAPGSETLV